MWTVNGEEIIEVKITEKKTENFIEKWTPDRTKQITKKETILQYI